MAEGVGKCHLKKTCTNYDVTSNLKQKRHGQVVKRQSRGLMSARSSHSSNFSAWIERFKSLDFVNEDYNDQLGGEAQVAAVELQAKLAQIEKDRNERLEKFQQDVCERVKRVRRQKLNEQMKKSIENVEKETNVICQSAFPKRIPSAMKDTCSFRSSISIDKIKNIMTGEANYDPSHNIENVLKSVEEIDQKARMIKQQSDQARACLVSKIIETNVMELPGGFWGKPKPKLNDLDMGYRDPGKKELEDQEKIDDFDEVTKSVQVEETRRRGKILNDMWKNFDANPKQETTTNGETSSSNNDRSDQISRISNQERKDKRTEKKIRFQIPESDVTDLPKENLNEVEEVMPQTKTDAMHLDYLTKKDTTDENKNKNQYWTCRKLFMDIEREKVRERQRRKKHQQVISRLKRDKEIERSIIEKEVEVILPNKSCEKQEDDVQQFKDQKIWKEKKKDSKVATRRKEILRYIDALKNLIRQKTIGHEHVVPSICSCGNSLLDTNPETCANNCIFYNNPKELARVLSSVLSSIGS